MRQGARLAARESAVCVAPVRTAATVPADSPGPAAVGGYRLVRRLAATAQTEVWEAHRADRRFALKRSAPGARASIVAALRLEYRRGLDFVHDSIVRPLDWLDADGRGAIVFDYLDGGDLATLAGGRVDTWVRPMLDLLAAIEYLHDRGFAHRDVKARNVLLDGADRARLIDLGSCRRFGSKATAGGTTPAHRLDGTSARVSAADDLYAFAVLIDEMLTPDAGDAGVVPDAAVERLHTLAADAQTHPYDAPRDKLRDFGFVLGSTVLRSELP